MTRQAPRTAIFLALAVLLAGAGYLYAVRGTALMIDLSALGAIFCF